MKKTIRITNIRIYATKDYALFKTHGLQRPIKQARVQALIEWMSVRGFSEASPVEVCEEFDGGYSLRTNDGHHRVEAAKTLGIEVYFVIVDKKWLLMPGNPNQGVAWSTMDYARFHALSGNKNYITLLHYGQKGIPILVAAALLAGSSAVSAGNHTEAIIDGLFKVKSTTQIDAILAFIQDLQPVCQVVGKGLFIKALSMCYYVEGFSLAQLRARIIANVRGFVDTATCEQMLKQIEEFYNYRTREKMPNLAFLATEAAKTRMLTRNAA